MPSLYISELAWMGIAVTFHILALSMGSFRLIQRCRTKHYYWDDLLVLCCLICDVTLFVVVLTREREFLGKELRGTLSAWHLLLQLCVPSVVWSSRISIAFSLLRLIKFDIWRKRLMIVVIIAFVLVWATIVISAFVCNKYNGTPKHSKLSHSSCSKSIIRITSFAAYITADGFLIYISLRLLRNLRLPRGRRLMVRVVFSSLGLSTVTGLIHDGISIDHSPQARRVQQLTNMLKAPVALIVCSLIVVMPCIYRLFKKDDEFGMTSISIHIDESIPGPETTTSNTVSQPERAMVRNPGVRSFSNLPVQFAHASLAGRAQSYSWPQRARVQDESNILGVKC